MKGFPDGSDSKESACSAGDTGSIPGSGRSPREGNGNPFQYSCLENPMDRGAWRAIVYGVAKSRTQLSDWTELNWNAKVGSQETPRVTGKFGLGVQNEAGQRLIEFFQENTLVITNTLFQQHKRRLYTWTSPDGQHQNQIIFFAAKDGEALYSQQKQDQELTVAQIMNSLLPN